MMYPILPRHSQRLGWLVLVVVAVSGDFGDRWAGAAEGGGYPRVNVATGYTVDPAWPQRSADRPWAAMPGVAVDAQDRVWTFTRSKVPVQVYDEYGNSVRTWGQGMIGQAHHIRIDHEQNVWLADIGHHVVQRYTPQGKLLLTLGTKGAAGEDPTHLNKPTDMAITPSGDVFVSDGYGNNRVVHFDRNGQFVKAWGKLGSGPGEFSLPHSIVVDSRGRLYVADRNNARIQVFDQNGTFLAQWANIIVPWGLWAAGNDDIWACGSSASQWRPGQSNVGVPPKDQAFMRFNSDGKLLQLWMVPKGVDGQEKPGDCNWVHAIALDSKGNVYVGDILGKRAQKFVRQAGRTP